VELVRTQAQLKEADRNKRTAAAQRANPDFKAKLRRQFVENAHKYLGVPYAQR
jgi:hypothetical protein